MRFTGLADTSQDFIAFKNNGSSADEPLKGKRVNMPSGKRKARKDFPLIQWKQPA